jgi:hypothetical protein
VGPLVAAALVSAVGMRANSKAGGNSRRGSDCLVGMEACGSAIIGRVRSSSQATKVKLMSPRYVKPYRQGNKNDPNDAEASCEAVTRRRCGLYRSRVSRSRRSKRCTGQGSSFASKPSSCRRVTRLCTSALPCASTPWTPNTSCAKRYRLF